jgi:pimeloyl-ACP methyl ester carboxylesterase
VRLERSIDLDGPVHYLDFGGNGLPIVLVHGLGGSSQNWLGAGPLLTETGHVQAIDLAGFGRTPLTESRGCSIPENVALLDRFLEEVVGRPAILVGNSMGAMISTFETAAHPERVAALVLVDSAVPYPDGTPVDPVVEMTFGTYADPNGEEMVRAFVERMSPEDVVRTGMELSCHDITRVEPEIVAAHVLLQNERREMAWANRALVEAARSLLETNSADGGHFDAIRAVTVPTLMIHGEHDRLIPLVAAMAVAGRRPDWDLEILDGVGHAPQLEDPSRVASVIVRWLARVGVPSDAKALRPA